MKLKRILLIILFTILFLPFSVFASDGETKKLFVNIDILENGDINVAELASLEGSYNGRLREILYKNSTINSWTGKLEDFYGSDIYNGSSIENLKIYDVGDRNNVTFDSISDLSKRSEEYIEGYGSNGERGKYTKTELSNGYSLKIFNPSSTNSAFLITYTIKDAVVVHNDIAELAWNLIGNGYTDNIYYLESRINLPKEDDDVRVFLHGPLNGNIHRYENKYAKILYNFVGANNPVSVRLVFNKELVPNAVKHSNIDGKQSILEVEERLANEANRQRELIKTQNTIVTIFDILMIILIIFTIIYISYVKKQNENKTFLQDYYRDFPASYGPEILNYLMYKNIDNNALSASLLMIIEKKALKVIKTENKDWTLEKDDTYTNTLTEGELKVLNMIINVIGDGNKVTSKEIKTYGKHYSKAKKFINLYNNWISFSTKEAKKENFYKKAPSLYKLLSTISIIGTIICMFISMMLEINILFSLILFILLVILIVKIAKTKLRSEEGALQYKQWLAFKNFLKDFSTFNEKELPEIVLWGKYLVYATVLGCAKKLEKDMKIKIKDMDITSQELATYYLLDSFTDNIYITSDLVQSVNTVVSSSRSSIAASESSSSSGYGGGASGGGGSFGGGGGGGHF